SSIWASDSTRLSALQERFPNVRAKRAPKAAAPVASDDISEEYIADLKKQVGGGSFLALVQLAEVFIRSRSAHADSYRRQVAFEYATQRSRRAVADLRYADFLVRLPSAGLSLSSHEKSALAGIVTRGSDKAGALLAQHRQLFIEQFSVADYRKLYFYAAANGSKRAARAIAGDLHAKDPIGFSIHEVIWMARQLHDGKVPDGHMHLARLKQSGLVDFADGFTIEHHLRSLVEPGDYTVARRLKNAGLALKAQPSASQMVSILIAPILQMAQSGPAEVRQSAVLLLARLISRVEKSADRPAANWLPVNAKTLFSIFDVAAGEIAAEVKLLKADLLRDGRLVEQNSAAASRLYSQIASSAVEPKFTRRARQRLVKLKARLSAQDIAGLPAVATDTPSWTGAPSTLLNRAESQLLYSTQLDDRADGLTLLRSAAHLGSTGAMVKYARGISDAALGTTNSSLSFSYLLLAAEAGEVTAMAELGRRYLAGAGVAQNEEKAAYWLRKADHADDPNASIQLYFHHALKEPRSTLAQTWLARAVEMGSGQMMLRKAALLHDQDPLAYEHQVQALLTQAVERGHRLARRFGNQMVGTVK
ncbi:MAG: hypothetical protein AAF737_04375, partial [Pseudomonadota bacterium]